MNPPGKGCGRAVSELDVVAGWSQTVALASGLPLVSVIWPVTVPDTNWLSARGGTVVVALAGWSQTVALARGLPPVSVIWPVTVPYTRTVNCTVGAVLAPSATVN